MHRLQVRKERSPHLPLEAHPRPHLPLRPASPRRDHHRLGPALDRRRLRRGRPAQLDHIRLQPDVSRLHTLLGPDGRHLRAALHPARVRGDHDGGQRSVHRRADGCFPGAAAGQGDPGARLCGNKRHRQDRARGQGELGGECEELEHIYFHSGDKLWYWACDRR